MSYIQQTKRKVSSTFKNLSQHHMWLNAYEHTIPRSQRPLKDNTLKVTCYIVWKYSFWVLKQQLQTKDNVDANEASTHVIEEKEYSQHKDDR